MAKPIKKTDDESDEEKDNPAPSPEEEAEDEDPEADPEGKSPSKEEDIDYDAEAANEGKHRLPDPLKARESFAERERKRLARQNGQADPNEEDDEEEDDEKPLSRREARELLNSVSAKTLKVQTEQQALEYAKSLSKSESETQAIIAKWKNRIFPDTMPIKDQIEEMHAAVNRKKLAAKTGELARAIKSKDGVYNDPAGTHRDPLPNVNKAPKLAAGSPLADFKYNPATGLYNKKLPSGKTMYVNPKAGPGEKKRWVE